MKNNAKTLTRIFLVLEFFFKLTNLIFKIKIKLSKKKLNFTQKIVILVGYKAKKEKAMKTWQNNSKMIPQLANVSAYNARL